MWTRKAYLYENSKACKAYLYNIGGNNYENKKNN